MDSFTTLFFVKGLLMLSLGIWLGLGVFNNLVDSGTNRYLLGEMFTMSQLKTDSYLGKGLLHRAISSQRMTRITLSIVIIMQMIVIILFWCAAYQLFAVIWNHGNTMNESRAIATANIALAGYLGLWIFFLCGGLWFGYWMKMGHVQQVHMMLVIIAVASLIFINSPGIAG